MTDTLTTESIDIDMRKDDARKLLDTLATQYVDAYGASRESKLDRGRVLVAVANARGLLYYATTAKNQRDADEVPAVGATVDAFADYVSGKLTQRYDATLSRQAASKLRRFAVVVDTLTDSGTVPESFVNLVTEGGARAVPATLPADEVVAGFAAIHGRNERPTAAVIAAQFSPPSDEGDEGEGDGMGDEGEATSDADETPTTFADVERVLMAYAASVRRGDAKRLTKRQTATVRDLLADVLPASK